MHEEERDQEPRQRPQLIKMAEHGEVHPYLSGQDEIQLSDRVLALAGDAHKQDGVAPDLYQRVGTEVDGHVGAKGGCRDAESRDVEPILTATRIGVEAIDPVVAESRPKDENVVAALPFIVSLPVPPITKSLPAPALMVSLPPRPSSRLTAPSPVILSLLNPPMTFSIEFSASSPVWLLETRESARLMLAGTVIADISSVSCPCGRSRPLSPRPAVALGTDAGDCEHDRRARRGHLHEPSEGGGHHHHPSPTTARVSTT